jgi:hypothetical protein
MKCTGERVARFLVCLHVVRPFPVISTVELNRIALASLSFSSVARGRVLRRLSWLPASNFQSLIDGLHPLFPFFERAAERAGCSERFGKRALRFSFPQAL